MKRKEIINKLIKEGFSEKTLIILSDKQLGLLSERILKESEVLIPKDKLDTPEVQNLKNKKEIIRTYENDSTVGQDDDMFIPSGSGDSKDELLGWVERLSEQRILKEKKQNSFTSKKSIMEIIKRKINEYGQEKETITAPPKTKPDTAPRTIPDRMNPWKPSPGKNPKPKAGIK